MDFKTLWIGPAPILRGHGVNCVRNQIHQHLLELNLFASYPRQPFVNVGLNGDPMSPQLVTDDGQSFLDDIVDIERSRVRTPVLKCTRIFSITASARCPVVTTRRNAFLALSRSGSTRSSQCNPALALAMIAVNGCLISWAIEAETASRGHQPRLTFATLRQDRAGQLRVKRRYLIQQDKSTGMLDTNPDPSHTSPALNRAKPGNETR